jgi:hypothetical protein
MKKRMVVARARSRRIEEFIVSWVFNFTNKKSYRDK